jgi:phosphoribosylformylglycinamidine synthase
LGKLTSDFNCSEYLHHVCDVEFSPAPYFNLDEELALHKKLAELISKQFIRSAHDVSEGGLFVTLCESSFQNEFGFSIQTINNYRKDGFLFGESQGRVVVSVNLDKAAEFEHFIADFPCEKIGVVTQNEVMVDGDYWGTIDRWADAYNNSIANYLSKAEAETSLDII